MNGFYKFMSKRYGADLFSWILLLLTFALILIVGLFDIWWLCLLPIIPAAFALFRTLSTNIDKRKQENMIFTGLPAYLRMRMKKFKERKTHIFYRCVRCNCVLRIKRGGGMRRISCPRCSAVFELDTGAPTADTVHNQEKR